MAGGAGGVAFELAFRRGIPCVVVDPRPMRLNQKQRRALRNRANAAAVLGSAAGAPNASWWLGGGEADGAGSGEGGGEGGGAARSAGGGEAGGGAGGGAGSVAGGGVVGGGGGGAGGNLGGGGGGGGGDGGGDGDVAVQCGEAEEVAPEDEVHEPADWALAWEQEGLARRNLPRQICSLFDENFARGPHAALFREASIVVGMHPDQVRHRPASAEEAASLAPILAPCPTLYPPPSTSIPTTSTSTSTSTFAGHQRS